MVQNPAENQLTLIISSFIGSQQSPRRVSAESPLSCFRVSKCGIRKIMVQSTNPYCLFNDDSKSYLLIGSEGDKKGFSPFYIRFRLLPVCSAQSPYSWSTLEHHRFVSLFASIQCYKRRRQNKGLKLVQLPDVTVNEVGNQDRQGQKSFYLWY